MIDLLERSAFWKGKIEDFDLLPDLSALQLGRRRKMGLEHRPVNNYRPPRRCPFRCTVTAHTSFMCYSSALSSPVGGLLRTKLREDGPLQSPEETYGISREAVDHQAES